MDVLFLLIPLSVVLVFLIGAVFWLALKGGQFEDLESPGLKVLLDDDTPAAAPTQPAADVVTGKAEEGNRRD
jgi:cbb3-type cytochrome oxidase maturation protein